MACGSNPDTDRGDVHGTQVVEPAEIGEEHVLSTRRSRSDRLVVEDDPAVIQGVDCTEQLCDVIGVGLQFVAPVREDKGDGGRGLSPSEGPIPESLDFANREARFHL